MCPVHLKWRVHRHFSAACNGKDWNHLEVRQQRTGWVQHNYTNGLLHGCKKLTGCGQFLWAGKESKTCASLNIKKDAKQGLQHAHICVQGKSAYVWQHTCVWVHVPMCTDDLWKDIREAGDTRLPLGKEKAGWGIGTGWRFLCLGISYCKHITL